MLNSGFLEAFAPGLLVLGGSVNNAKGVIRASGSGAVVSLSGATISGGQWQTVLRVREALPAAEAQPLWQSVAAEATTHVAPGGDIPPGQRRGRGKRR